MTPPRAEIDLLRQGNESDLSRIKVSLLKQLVLQNKPNGQFHLEFDAEVIRGFMRDLPIRKVPGIGRVTERLLDSIGIKVNDKSHYFCPFKLAQTVQGMRGRVRASCRASSHGQGVWHAVVI